MSLAKLRTLDVYKNLPRSVGKSKLNREELLKVLGIEVAPSPKCKEVYEFNDNHELIQALKIAMMEYYRHGVRSSKKLDALHFFINCIIEKRIHQLAPDLSQNIVVHSQPYREIKVDGMLYDKDVDITVTYKKNPVGLVSVKFVTSNYKQNSNNYFENMVGECINLKTVKRPRVFWYSMFIFKDTPYYNINNGVSRYEKINLKTDLDHLRRVYALRDAYVNLPDCISVSIIDNRSIQMIHPKNFDASMNLQAYVANLFDHGIMPTEPFVFWKQLEEFCQKTIKVIRNHYERRARQRLPMASL